MTKGLSAGALIVAALSVGSCVPIPEGDIGAGNEEATRPLSPSGKPDHAFQIGEDLYAVPLAVDENGCEEFTTWSDTGARSLTKPLYYHDGKGSFTATKVAEGSCSATMVKMGVDSDGCAIFRAEQPGGFTSAITYYASGQGYTVRKERSDCG